MEHPKKQSLFSYSDMITHLTSIGVQFNEVSEKDATEILKSVNYYYKLGSYKKNYFKHPDSGQYVGLEFAALIDIASVDMQLRYYLLQMALDVEHSIKTVLMDLITRNPLEDGYSIVKEFEQQYPTYYEQTLKSFSKSKYLNEMYIKRSKRIPIWVLLEIMSFGALIKFVDMYYKKYKNIRLYKAVTLLSYARHTRNSCAHSNVILLNIKGKKNRISGDPISQVSSLARDMKIPKGDVYFKKIHDMVCLFALHKYYCSPGSNLKVNEKGYEIKKRWERNYHLIKPSSHLTSMKENFVKMVDYLV